MTVLDRIFAQKREELPLLEAAAPIAELKAVCAGIEPPRGFRRRLAESPHRPSLIAECKKHSPVKGPIAGQDYDPVALARAYEAAGAECLSVLTDAPHFQGSADHLRACRAAVGLPVIRKDFTAGLYHVWEARAMGADCILLIAAMLEDGLMRDAQGLAIELGMDVLMEVHTEEEAERALALGSNFIGVNNRDLATFEVNLEASERIIPNLPAEVHSVSESALHSAEDVDRVRRAGARSVLIGTAFSGSPDPARRIREVMGR
ncbi:MAG: indole-3-glycerol phosphate synthase TrpC [Fimbriimonadaceae bacterium]|nr:indole-3-glycerol phosphate synthase TrpC [Fimbriimonadaceae bacterium]